MRNLCNISFLLLIQTIIIFPCAPLNSFHKILYWLTAHVIYIYPSLFQWVQWVSELLYKWVCPLTTRSTHVVRSQCYRTHHIMDQTAQWWRVCPTDERWSICKCYISPYLLKLSKCCFMKVCWLLGLFYQIMNSYSLLQTVLAFTSIAPKIWLS